jgi:hypothetical protein
MKLARNPRSKNQPKPLPESIKTIGDWIKSNGWRKISHPAAWRRKWELRQRWLVHEKMAPASRMTGN